MPKRVAVLGLSHETNTFSPIRTEYADFERGGMFRGGEVLSAFEGGHAVVSGFLDASRECGFEIVPLLFARAEPSGVISNDATSALLEELVSTLCAALPVDGVLITLHGAAVSDLDQDLDGTVLLRIRAAVGPDVPIGAVFDMHANASERMVQLCDWPVFYRTNPHLDTYDRGLECGRIMGRVLAGDVRPVHSFVRLPIIQGITRSNTNESPMRDLLDEMEVCLDVPGVLSASLVEGFPWSDVPDTGMSVVVVTDSDQVLANTLATRLATRVWARREEMIDRVPDPLEAMTHAGLIRDERGPVGVLDIGDNIGGGGGGDSTILLAIALEQGLNKIALTMFDPESARICISAGVGNYVELALGGKVEKKYCQPLQVCGTVIATSNGRFEETGNTHEGYRYFNSGDTAVLRTEGDISIVITSNRVGNVSQMQFRSVGVQPAEQRLLILKGVNAPRGAFGSVCSRFVLANTPGSTSIDLQRLDYRSVRRPMYPLDAQAALRL